MALNYAKLNEIIDLMELTRSYVKYQRPVNIVESGKPVTWNWRTITQHYKENLAILGAESNIGAVIDNYFQSALYGKRKARETMNVAGMNIDYGRITDSLRDKDMLFRFGGEEFVILFSDTSKEDAIMVAERIRQKVADFVFPFEERQPNGDLTISVGVAFSPSDAIEKQSLLQIADERLYKAKSGGRNRVVWE